MNRLHVLALGCLALSTSAFARNCFTVTGKVETMETATNCASPVGICTQGRISGDGLLKGKTHYVVDQILGMAQADGPDAPATLLYSGTFVLTAHDGSTLTFRDMGMLDQANGMDSGQGSGLVGTGRYSGVTGQLFFYGNAGEAGFKENFTGKLCVPRSNR